MKSIRWFSIYLAGLATGGGLGAGVLAVASPGDLVYESNTGKVEITQQKALSAANWAISNGVWDGDASDIIKLCIERDPGTDSGFSASVVGLKSTSPANLPVGEGVKVVGLVE